jgi:hypothetical protein
MEKRRPQRRQPDDHNFGSFLMLAVTSRRVSAGGMGRAKGAFLLPSGVGDPLKPAADLLESNISMISIKK